MPPSNSGYYIAAYAAAAFVYVVYGLSIIMRSRRLRSRHRARRPHDDAR